MARRNVGFNAVSGGKRCFARASGNFQAQIGNDIIPGVTGPTCRGPKITVRVVGSNPIKNGICPVVPIIYKAVTNT